MFEGLFEGNIDYLLEARGNNLVESEIEGYYKNYKEGQIPDNILLLKYFKGEIKDYFWVKELPKEIIDCYDSSKDKEYFVQRIHLFHMNIYNNKMQDNIKYSKNQIFGYLRDNEDDKGERSYNHPDDKFRYELNYYGLDVNRPYNTLDTVTMLLPGVAINGIFMAITYFSGMGLHYLQWLVMLIMVVAFLGITVTNGNKNNKKIKDINQLKTKYSINKDFQLLDNNIHDRQMVEISNKKGNDKVVEYFNKPYKLSDGMPVRLYQLLTVSKNKIIISHNVYDLTEDEDYKEMLLSEKLSESEFIDLYNRLKEESELDNNYTLIENGQKQLIENGDKYEKAKLYLEDYTKLYNQNKDELGLGENKEKWSNRLEESKQQNKLNLIKNKEYIKREKIR